MTETAATGPRPRVLWLSGLVLGAADGVAILVAGVVGVALLALTIALIVVRGPRLFVSAGFVTGMAGVWTALLARVRLTCDATNALPGQSCGTGDNDVWLLASAAILALGIGASVIAFRTLRARD